METPTVQRITEQTVANVNGQFQTTYTVTFMVGQDGPFTVQIPQPEFNAANVQAKMQTIADEINTLHGTAA